MSDDTLDLVNMALKNLQENPQPFQEYQNALNLLLQARVELIAMNGLVARRGQQAVKPKV